MSTEVSALLSELEQELRRQHLWATSAPSPEALSSQEPFCVDTLSFVEWLQWIYIPRLRALIDRQAQLPSGAVVHPYAEEALTGSSGSVQAVLKIVARLDAAMK